MKELIIINKYAISVVEVIKKDHYGNCLRDAELLMNIFHKQPHLIDILHTKLVDRSKKADLINQLTAELYHSEMWKKLFELLISNYRFYMIDQIISAIKHNIYQKQDILVIKLILAHPQQKEVTDKIIKYLESVFKQKVIPEIEYDKTIIGGFYAETTDMIVDGSIRNNLSKFVNISQK